MARVALTEQADVATDRLAAASANAVDPATVSFRRAAGTAIAHSERRLEGAVSFGRGRAVIVETLGGGCGINSLRDEFADVDDPLALVDARLDVVTHSHW